MATTPNWNIVYPVVGTTMTPLANHFANLANSTDTALGTVEGLVTSQNRQFKGTAAAKASVTGMVFGDTYQETDGSKLLWSYDGSNWFVLNSLISLKNNTPQALAAGVVTDISFQVALSNRGVAVSLPVTSVTIPSSGIYEIAGALTCNHVAASFFNAYLTINGADVQLNTGSVFPHVNTYSRVLLSTASYSLSAGDTVKMRAMSPNAATVEGNSTSPGAVLNIKRV